MSMTKYTIGNWSVSADTTDTDTTAKNFAIPNLKFASDFTKTQDEPGQAIIANATGTGIESSESIRFACSTVNNVYANAGVDVALQPPLKKGVQVMAEIKTTYHAENSVSGASVDLPCVGRVVLRFPTYSVVTDDLVEDLLKRTVASIFADGKTDVSRVLDLARNSLLPDGM